MVTRKTTEDASTSTLPARPVTQNDTPKSEQITSLIEEITADMQDLENFYNITFSATRIQRVGEYLVQRRNELVLRFMPFEDLSQEAKVDFLLIKTHLERRIERLRVEWERLEEVEPLLGDWAKALVELCEKRQKVVPVEGKEAAKVLAEAESAIDEISAEIRDGKMKLGGDRFAAYRCVLHLQEMQGHLREWYGFYEGYDPMFTWWTRKPWEDLSVKLTGFASLIRRELVGIDPGDKDAIVGQPIGEKGLLSELHAEMIAYSPEELIQIAEKEYEWCEKEAIKASQLLGFGPNWLAAQEHIKATTYVSPGQQPLMVHSLAAEAVAYIQDHDMVTIPPIANECWRTTMIPPAQQKTSPFFLGGSRMQVAYPTDSMSHAEKMMIMRGNNKPFSRSTVFHEMVPGHHLQYHYMARSKTHRKLFSTPFWIEGWAFYWEMILWDRGFASTPEDRLGMLFWRMHRCMRIVFSLNFHLGKMTPQECIDLLVAKVGHERATAEGEVRRSLNGDYGPLYQAGYMLGALQFYRLRKEVVEGGRMGEKEFHDFVLRQNNLPVEILRALILGEELEMRYQPKWRFYDL